MVAGLVAGLMQGQDPPDVLRLGVACGSATAASPGTNIFTAPEVESLLGHVKAEKLAG
jgi:6-phosphofructokinase 2